MANWYDKYLSIYGKPFSEVPQEIIDGTRKRLAALQSAQPLASIVVIDHHDASVLGGPTEHGSLFHSVRQGCGPCDLFD